MVATRNNFSYNYARFGKRNFSNFDNPFNNFFKDLRMVFLQFLILRKIQPKRRRHVKLNRYRRAKPLNIMRRQMDMNRTGKRSYLQLKE